MNDTAEMRTTDPAETQHLVILPHPNHNSTAWHGSHGPLMFPCTHNSHCQRVKGHCCQHLNRLHMKRKVLLKCFHSTCSYLHPYLSSVSLNEWGGGITGLQRQLQLIRNVKGPQPSEQAGKPYHIWQQRLNLVFINERSERDSGLTCKGWAPIPNDVLHIS